MTTLREAAQQALEALGLWATGRDMDAVALNDLIFRLEDALAQPQKDSVDEYRKGFIAGQIDMRDREQAEPVQEPVAWRYKYSDGFWRFSNGSRVNGCDPIESQALYTAPPQRKPLTHGEIREMFFAELRALPPYPSAIEELPERFARAIERAHGIGGTNESA